ncbi:hypothetical protein ACFC00_38885 [Streptomyces adustus]|uniref:hypothetical protein n=1 Tax=Streptomyces adustus TaxID=1609272 RepID=UPI0035DB2DE1
MDADHPRPGHDRLEQRVDQAQDRAQADGHAEDGSPPGAGTARHDEADRSQGRTQPLGALAVPAGQARYLLHEDPARTHGVPAIEPPDPELEGDAPSGAWYVHGKPQDL